LRLSAPSKTVYQCVGCQLLEYQPKLREKFALPEDIEYYLSTLAREHSHLLCVTPMCWVGNYFELIMPFLLITERTISCAWESLLRATVSAGELLKVRSTQL
jgi:hypothetical protein